MEKKDFVIILKTKTFMIIFVLFFIWLWGFLFFLTNINPDSSKLPGLPQNFLRDFIWLFYWRWNLDYLMISLWFIVIILESHIFRRLQKKYSKETLSMYVSPILTISFVYLYMLAIDIGVTFFADTNNISFPSKFSTVFIINDFKND